MTIVSLSGIIMVILVIVYMLIGLKFRKFAEQSDEDYLLAGRNVPFWMMGAAYLGSMFGGTILTGSTSYGFTGGMSLIWASAVPCLGITIFICFFAKKLNYFGRTYGAITMADFLCARYGEGMRLPVGILAFLRSTLMAGLQFLAISVALTIAFGWSMLTSLIVAACMCLIFLLTAGQFSAMVNQWIQAIVQNGSILLFSYATISLLGSPSEAIETIYATLPENFTNGLSATFSDVTTWVLTLCIFYTVDPWMFMNTYLGSSPRVSQNAQLVTTSGQFYVILIFISGMSVATASMTGKISLPDDILGDQIFSYIAFNEASLLVGTILIVGLIMTIISSASSLVMTGTTAIANDIYKKFIKKGAEVERK